MLSNEEKEPHKLLIHYEHMHKPRHIAGEYYYLGNYAYINYNRQRCFKKKILLCLTFRPKHLSI